jgi:hypothetical protein
MGCPNKPRGVPLAYFSTMSRYVARMARQLAWKPGAGRPSGLQIPAIFLWAVGGSERINGGSGQRVPMKAPAG